MPEAGSRKLEAGSRQLEADARHRITGVPVLASGLDYVDLNFLGRPEIIATAILHGTAGVALVDPGPRPPSTI